MFGHCYICMFVMFTGSARTPRSPWWRWETRWSGKSFWIPRGHLLVILATHRYMIKPCVCVSLLIQGVPGEAGAGGATGPRVSLKPLLSLCFVSTLYSVC